MLDSGSGWGFGGFSGVGEGAEVELEEAADGELLLGLGAPGESSGELGYSDRRFADRST